MFQTAYNAIEEQSLINNWHFEVNMDTGRAGIFSPYISSLGGFWPALQILNGNVLQAERTFAKFEEIWNLFEAIPDLYNIQSKSLLDYGRDFPLRPEMVRK
jgi:hypothetical protein